jgi:putative tricarboxylic transport membrane protein
MDFERDLAFRGGVVRNKEVIGSIFWIGIGLIFFIGALKYGIYEENAPGPGMIPFLGAVILIFLGLALIVVTRIRFRKEREQEKMFFSEKDSIRKVFLAVLATATYGITLEYLGFILTSFLFMIFSMRYIEPQKWKMVLTTSFLTAVVSYLLFQIILKVQLPHGILFI